MSRRDRYAEIALLAAVLCATLAFSLAPRIEEYQRWHDQRAEYFYGESPISGFELLVDQWPALRSYRIPNP